MSSVWAINGYSAFHFAGHVPVYPVTDCSSFTFGGNVKYFLINEHLRPAAEWEKQRKDGWRHISKIGQEAQVLNQLWDFILYVC